MRRRALFIVNRGSRLGNGDLLPAREVLRGGGIELLEQRPGSGGEVGALIREHRDRVDCVVLGGGDGTLQSAAAALLETGLPLGILPLGTANDLARTLGLPSDAAQAAAVIAAGRVRKVDVGRANDSFFFNVAHVGLGARVRTTLSPELKRSWGSLSYLRGLLDLVRERRAFQVRAEHDGRVELFRSIQIAVGNGRHYGGGMTVAEDAEIDDAACMSTALRPSAYGACCAWCFL